MIKYQRRSSTAEIPNISFSGMVSVYRMIWRIPNEPHAGILIMADGIKVDGEEYGIVGNALVLDLKRRNVDCRSLVSITLLRGTTRECLNFVSVTFLTVPSLQYILQLPGSDICDFSAVLRELDNVEFSLDCSENGVNCISLENDIISHYSTSRYRLRVQTTCTGHIIVGHNDG